MTKGKHATAVAARAAQTALTAVEHLKSVEAQLRERDRRLEAKDREIEVLKSALGKAREEHTLIGTHSDADMERLRFEMVAAHREAIRAGFRLLPPATEVFPEDRFAEVAEAFQCEPFDLLSPVPNATRRIRRTTVKSFRAVEGRDGQKRRA